jgi:hypothetical protein
VYSGKLVADIAMIATSDMTLAQAYTITTQTQKQPRQKV